MRITDPKQLDKLLNRRTSNGTTVQEEIERASKTSPVAVNNQVTCPKPKKRVAVACSDGGTLDGRQANKTERAYANLLELRRRAGEILWYKFEAIKFRLANNTYYTPDFVVLLANLEIEVHEVKGFWEEDARVKIKVASEMFPFRFFGVQLIDKQWKYEEFK